MRQTYTASYIFNLFILAIFCCVYECVYVCVCVYVSTLLFSTLYLSVARARALVAIGITMPIVKLHCLLVAFNAEKRVVLSSNHPHLSIHRQHTHTKRGAVRCDALSIKDSSYFSVYIYITNIDLEIERERASERRVVGVAVTVFVKCLRVALMIYH